MSWYERQTCAVCEKTIGRKYFWQDKPRVVDAGGKARDAGYLSEEQATEHLRTEILVCPGCYFNRFGDVTAVAARRAGAR